MNNYTNQENQQENNYLLKFLDKNKEKSFTSILSKYNELNYYGKCKCLSSFLTHLFIDAEQLDITADELKYCIQLQEELLSLINELMLTKTDRFVIWLGAKLDLN